MATDFQLRTTWGPRCATTAQRATVVLWTGVAADVHVGTEQAWSALDQVMHHHGYMPRSGVTGAMSCRDMTGHPGLLSLHAFGIALDVNWDRNGYGYHLVTDMPDAMVEHIEAIRTNGGLRVFTWGGDWNDNDRADDGTYDAMHYELFVTPAQLAAGIDWNTVVGVTPPTPPGGPGGVGGPGPIPSPPKHALEVAMQAGPTLWRLDDSIRVHEIGNGTKRWVQDPVELQDMVNDGRIIPHPDWPVELAAAAAYVDPVTGAHGRPPDFDKAVNKAKTPAQYAWFNRYTVLGAPAPSP